MCHNHKQQKQQSAAFSLSHDSSLYICYVTTANRALRSAHHFMEVYGHILWILQMETLKMRHRTCLLLTPPYNLIEWMFTLPIRTTFQAIQRGRFNGRERCMTCSFPSWLFSCVNGHWLSVPFSDAVWFLIYFSGGGLAT